MAPLIPAAIAAKAGEKAAQALVNDIAVYRTVYTKGKGKQKRVIDREIHINPVSIGVGGTALVVGIGAAAVMGGIALFASGMQAQRVKGAYSTSYTVVQTVDGSGENPPRWTVYNARGVPIRRNMIWNGDGDLILSDAQKARGFKASRSEIVPNTGGKKYTVKITNPGKKQFALTTRPHISLLGGGLLGGNAVADDGSTGGSGGTGSGSYFHPIDDLGSGVN